MKDTFVKIGKILLYIGIGAFVVDGIKFTKSTEHYVYTSNCGYGEAIEAINNSDMWSDDKRDAISILPSNQSSSFYKGIISIAESDMWSDDKLSAIKNASKGN